LSVREINFDGLIGPTHNYAGLSLGNTASEANAGAVARPRQAALQGLAKMRVLMDLGLEQGFFPPLDRPAVEPLRALGFSGDDDAVLAAAARDEPAVFRAACAASSMWAANAATVIAAADSRDGRIHIVPANLSSMLHRAFEADGTTRLLRRVFTDAARFHVHDPLPFGRHFGDEGAANHMRVAPSHGARGVNVFIHGADRDGRYPERQSARASRAVARMAGVEAPVFVLQSAEAVQAGAFHNDVVAVANETVLLTHPQAFDDPAGLYAQIARRLPQAQVVELDIPLASAVAGYLFNSQLVTLPDGDMALIAPAETCADPVAWAAVERLLAADNPVRRAVVVEVRESMRNGGGPACLRLRVPADEAARAAIDARFLLTPARWEALHRLVEAAWPDTVAADDLADPKFWAVAREANRRLAAFLELEPAA
jgi:succinylarginine dihydrolase